MPESSSVGTESDSDAATPSGHLEEAFDRAVLKAAIQEVAGLKKPPKLKGRPRGTRVARYLLRAAESRWGLTRVDLGPSGRLWLHAVLVIGLRLAMGTFWRLGLRSVWEAVRERVARHAERAGPGVGYVLSSPKEDQVVRVSFLMRMKGRRSDALRLLAARYRSPLPKARTTRLLASWLEENGETEAAATLLAGEAPADTPRPAVKRHVPRRLRYGVVVLAMFDTEIFRASVRSLLESDFHGRVVVVEDGHTPVEGCRAFCESVGVGYVKNPSWTGCAAGLNLGIQHLESVMDVAFYSHSDVLWPPEWFADLDRAWETVYDTDKVGLLNLGYLQITSRVDPGLTGMFVGGRYEDLLWVLRALRELPPVMDRVQVVQAKPGEEPFGLARDPWVDWIPDLRQMTGRLSVAASFPVHVWREIGGFDPELVYAFDLQFLHHNLAHKRWTLFVNTSPVIHLKSSDTEAIPPELLEGIGPRLLDQTYDGFKRKYGWHIEHFLNLYFSESTVVHRDAILAAANRFRFNDIDFVFDDFAARLATRKLDNCELTWCRVRKECPHV